MLGAPEGSVASFRGASRSRRPRLDAVDAGHLVLVARSALFGDSGNRSPEHVVTVLESASRRGNEEASWLLRNLTSDGPVPVDPWKKNRVAVKLSRLAEVLSNEDSPRANYYRARSTPGLEYGSGLGWGLMLRSAENGFAPAMSQMGIRLSRMEGTPWLLRAAERNDPDALCYLSFRSNSKQLDLLLASAKAGHVGSMSWLASEGIDELGRLECATQQARSVFLNHHEDFVPWLSESLKRLQEGEYTGEDVQLVFNYGRELEGFDQFWDEGESVDVDHLRSIEVYLLLSHRARRAALQAVVALKQLGLPRDVAVLIARHVYGSRGEAVVWYPQYKGQNEAANN